MPTQSDQPLMAGRTASSQAVMDPGKPVLVHWPAVAAAAALAMLLVAIFTTSAWIVSRSSRTAEPRTAERPKANPLPIAGDVVHAVVDQPARIERPAQPNQEPASAPELLALAGRGLEQPAARATPSTNSSSAMLGLPVAQFGTEAQATVRCETFGTRVQFVRNPDTASLLANRERKLVFLPQISGNFEDQRFT